MKARRCKACGKNNYRSELMAYRAAIQSSRSFGKPFRIYECPVDSSKFHVTSLEDYYGARR